jgi:glycosyltransferase involved in cell wall biosynthesis
VLYLPNGIAAAQAAEMHAPAPGQDAVLFFTRFVEVTPAWLAEFTASLYAIRPSMRLVVAGAPVQPGLDEPFRRALAATAAGAQVEWVGFVPPAQLPALYARSGCAIFPAAPVPLQQAKCSVRLATTLLQGLPVIASAVGEQAAYGAEGAARLVAPAASPAEFATAVDDVLRHPAQQLALAAAARTRLLQRYGWSNLAAALGDFYAKLLSSRP